MMQTPFVNYLIKRSYQPKTAMRYGKLIATYFNWCATNDIDSNWASLEELYQYKNQFVERGYHASTIRQHIAVIKLYFNFLEREENPALLVKHKKRETTLPSYILSEQELKDLYQNLIAHNIIQRRNKIMIGMVIFQGVKREELDLVEISHLNLERTTLYIPSTTRAHSRTVELHSMQMAHLSSYIYEVRPRLQIEAHKPETEKLFFSMGTGNSVQNGLQIKLNELKRLCPQFKSLTQIKESRMMIWVKENGIRKAQYLSGIKYTSSMLRYKTTDIDKLRTKLAIVHPMERLNTQKIDGY